MQLLFKPASGATTVGATNFKDHYPHVNKNMSWDVFLPVIRQVTRDYIQPYIGKEFYDAFAAEYHTDENGMSEDEQWLLSLLQDAIAKYTVWTMSPSLNVTIGDMGIQEQHGKEGMTPAASTWRYYHFYWKVMVDADKHLDTALQYLEDNGTAFDDFDETLLTFPDAIMRTTADFEKHFWLNGSRRTFLKLQPSINLVTRRKIVTVLGQSQYDELLAAQKAGNLTTAQRALLEKCQAVIAHAAIAIAVPQLAVIVESNGIFVVSSSDGQNTKQTATEERIKHVQVQAQADADEALAHLTDWLYVNEDSFATWKASDEYGYWDGGNGLPQILGDYNQGGVSL